MTDGKASSSARIGRKGKTMSKKIMVLTLSMVCAAMFALPAAVSASLSHISNGTETFTLSGKDHPAQLSSTSGTTISCTEVGGSGKFETTTTGTVQLTFGPTCTTILFGVTDHCQSLAQGAPHNFATSTGIVRSTTLPFHLVTEDSGHQAILLTPNASGAFAHWECETIFGNIEFTITGNGLLGEITTPACGNRGKTMTIDFISPAHGLQALTKVTGVTYNLKKGEEVAAQTGEATITFAGEPTFTCT
jgi:hypothetical protein